MADLHQDGAGAGADFDLSQFYQIFFEEAAENLDQMEQMLLNLDLSAANDEELNGIFRCAHSIKGGAATFGFADVTELTHRMESLLDRLRRHEITPIPEMVDVLLESADASRSLLARHQAGNEGEALSTTDLVARIETLAEGRSAVPAAAAPAPAPTPAPAPVAAPAQAPAPVAAAPVSGGAVGTAPSSGGRSLHILIGPLERLEMAEAIKELFRDIPGLGRIEDLACDQPQSRLFDVQTSSTDDDLLDLFAFHVAKEQVRITAAGASAEAAPAAVAAQAPAAEEHAHDPDAALASAAIPPADEAYGFFNGAPGMPQADGALAIQPAGAVAKPAAKTAAQTQQAQMESTSIRVSVSKVDQLINLVGELVITQAMLKQVSGGMDPGQAERLFAGLELLERNTRDLQEAVIGVRMLPVDAVFRRFPRLVRDLSARLGKQVRLRTVGEGTELDKGLIEKIADPLVHLVRNSIDHGLEMPEVRKAAGKDETGTITLAASHQGGHIVIEVGDDGRGLDRARILAKAVERGLQVPDNPTDAQVWDLIFQPGFSTADQVTDLSGRGVGMDVVRRNIQALGGEVQLESAPGRGTRVVIRLPLTLAILDGMVVSSGGEILILPLSHVLEALQPQPGDVRTVAGDGRVLRVRGEYLPMLSLSGTFGYGGGSAESLVVVVEGDGQKLALQVEELVGQQQVVVKNLERNYRRVPGISGATILGDGRVALIVDVAGLARQRQLPQAA